MVATTSAARIAANRLNAQKSSGPKTAAGKARSRANALKHGLTGAGVALPTEDQSRVAARFVQFQEDMGPSDMLGMVLVQEMALMSVRLDRAARHEAAVLAAAVGRAAVEFDLARLAEVDRLFETIAANPGENQRRLLTIPEGVDRLIEALSAAKNQIEGGQARFWGEEERGQIEAFFGRRRVFFPISPTSALLEAIGGDFRWFGIDHPAHQLNPAVKQTWARNELIAAIHGELARLGTVRAGLDLAALGRERQGSADRALFDTGPDATYARRYEANAARRFSRALRDFQANEAMTGEEVTDEVDDPAAEQETSQPNEPSAEVNPSTAVAVNWQNEPTAPSFPSLPRQNEPKGSASQPPRRPVGARSDRPARRDVPVS